MVRMFVISERMHQLADCDSIPLAFPMLPFPDPQSRIFCRAPPLAVSWLPP